MKTKQPVTLTEVYYCTVDKPVPETVAVTFEQTSLKAGIRVSIDSETVPEDIISENIIHAVIHPNAAQRAVLKALKAVLQYVSSKTENELEGCFIQATGEQVTRTGGTLHMDENWDDYLPSGIGAAVSTTHFPDATVMVAISPPMSRSSALGRLRALIDAIKRDGLSHGTSFTPRGVGFTTEKNGHYRTEIISPDGAFLIR